MLITSIGTLRADGTKSDQIPRSSKMIYINDNRDSRGIEAEYYEDIQCIYIKPTNHKRDWKENFTGWLWPRWIKGYGLVNRLWWAEAEWLFNEVGSRGLMLKRIGGWSKGGAQAQYLDYFYERGDVFSIAGFPARPFGRLKGTLYRKRGDIVPLFSGRRYEECYKLGKWTRVSEAHMWPSHERYKIIYNKE